MGLLESIIYKQNEKKEDYTVLVHFIHQTHIILVDHKHNKVSYLYTLWNGNNLSFQEDGLHSNEYNGEVIVPLPNDGVIELVYGEGL